MMSGEDGSYWLRPTPESYGAPTADTVGQVSKQKKWRETDKGLVESA